MMFPWPQAVFAGVAGLMMFAAFVAVPLGGVLLIQVSIAPVMLAGLRGGPAGLAVAVASALAACAVVLPPAMIPVYAVVDLLPAALVGLLAHRGAPGLGRKPAPQDGVWAWYPPGRILAWSAVLSLVLLALFAASLPAAPGGAQGGPMAGGSMAEAVQGAVSEAVEAFLAEADTGTKTQVLAAIPANLPGVFLASWVARTAFCGLIALWWASRRQGTLRPLPALEDLTLPWWLVGLFLATTAVGLVGQGDLGYLAVNAAMGLSVPLVLMGLVLVHHAARQLPQPGLALVGFYLLFVLGSRAAVVALIAAGLVEVALKALRPPGSVPGGGQGKPPER